MLLKYFYDKSLAQASYLIGCAETGEALVVDPSRDITRYLQVSAEEGLKITHVTETHIHADYVSGSHELAHATGATLFLSGAGGLDWQYGYSEADFPIITVQDGFSWMVGNIRVEAMHTPGHTPEHMIFVITDTKGADLPIGFFSGDFIFAGDVGRPDLLEEAAGLVGTREIGARQQFQSLQRIKNYPDYLQVWFGHGAGSACGKSLGAIPSTTLGYEKRFNPAFQFTEEDKFVEWLLEGQPEAPRYFAQMKQVNKVGPALLAEAPETQPGTTEQLQSLLAQNALIIDFRPVSAYAQHHLPGSLSIPATSANFSTYVGWFVDYTQPLYLLLSSVSDLCNTLHDLRAIGVDNIPLFFLEDQIPHLADSLTYVTSGDLINQLDDVLILDVRGKTEYDRFHIQGSMNIPLGYLPRLADQLPHDRRIVTQCASGYRSQIAASWLRRAGFGDVVNLGDGESKWSKTLPIE